MRNATSPITNCFSCFFSPNQARKNGREEVNYAKHAGDVSLERLVHFNQQCCSHQHKMPACSQHQLAKISRELLLEYIIGRPRLAEKNYEVSKRLQLKKGVQNLSRQIGFEDEVPPEMVIVYPYFKLVNLANFLLRLNLNNRN